MPTVVDIDKTLSKQKIYYKDDGMFYVFNAYILVVSSLIGGGLLYYIWNHLTYYQTNKEELSFTIVLASTLMGGVIYKILKRRQVLETSLCKREFIIQALNELNWTIIKNEDNFIVANTDNLFRQISIVFDYNNLLIHTLVSTRGGGYWSETLKREIFLKKLEKLCETNSQNLSLQNQKEKIEQE